MLTENYMPCQDRKTASQIADCFTQHEALVCEYFRQQSRRWETRIFWYKVPGNIAKYTPDVAAPSGAGTRRPDTGTRRPDYGERAGAEAIGTEDV